MSQRKLFDICEAKHGGNAASTEAHRDNAENAEAQRRRILALVQAAGVDGMTCDELEQALGLAHQSCSARCSELKKAGRVRERGYRPTRTGSRAGVLVAVSTQSTQWWRHE